MSEFDVIECGFNEADETINFGSRMLAEGDHPFEAATLASMKPSDVTQTSNTVSLKTFSHRNKLYYTINKTIGIFSDLSCTEMDFNSSVEDPIDIFCVTPDSKCLLICQNNGTVSYINIEQQEILFNKELCKNEWSEISFYIDGFIEEFSKNTVTFIIVTRNGCIYRMKFEHMDSKSCNCYNELVHELQFKVKCAALAYPHLLVDGEGSGVYNLETGDLTSDESLNLSKIFSYSKDIFIGLDMNGNVVRICARTLFVFYTNNTTKFKDFIYTSISIGHSSTKPYFFGFTYDNNIQLYDSYPILSELKFSLTVNNDIHLICPWNIDEEPMYISIIEKQNMVCELRVQVIYETAPEVRLKRLLRRMKFDEAEQFAKQYHLDNTEVLKAKAQVIIDRRSCSGEDIFNLLKILDGIDDTLFKLQSCIDTYLYCDSVEDVQKILCYGCNCVVKYNMGTEVLQAHELISDIMFRFDTFVLIVKERYSTSDWLEFDDSDLIKLLGEYLEKYNIDSAIILYNRLDKHTKLKLDETSIEKILLLLDNLPMEVYQPFLHCFIPLSLSYVPTTLPLFVKWLKHKVYFIEQNNFDKFPETAIEFTNSTLHLMKVDYSNINFQQQKTINREATDDLAQLVKALQIVELLKSRYQIMVPLKEYLKGPKPLIHMLLSLNLNDDVFDKFLQNFLCKFMFENCIDPDEVFLEAIRNIIQYEENYWINIVPSILRNIRSLEVKLNAVINLIEVAEIPWCLRMREITRDCLEYQHELVEVIKKKVEYEPLYRILKKSSYELQDYTIDSAWDFEHIIGRIIYCNEDSMLDDIYQLCKTSKQRHTANVMLINHFVQLREYKQALNILDNNTFEEKMRCCESIMSNIKLNDEIKLHDRNDPYFELLKCLQQRCPEINEKIQNISVCLQIRSTLYNNMEISDLESSEKKEHLLETLLSIINEASNKLEKSVDSCATIANFLKTSEEKVMLKLCQMSTGDLGVIGECACYILDNVEEAKTLCLMATLILKSVCPAVNANDLLNTSNMNETLQEPLTSVQTQIKCLQMAHCLSTKAILCARRDELNACVEVFNWTMTTFHMVREPSTMEKCITSNIYVPEISLPSMRSMYCIKHIINSYISFSDSDVNQNLKYLTYFETAASKLTKEGFFAKIQQLPMMIQNICLEGQTLTAFKLVLTLKSGFESARTNLDTNVTKTLNNVVKQCIMQLLQKVFSSASIDLELAYGLLIACELNESINTINRQLVLYKRQVGKLKVLAQLALRVLNYHGTDKNKEFYVEVIQLSGWWISIGNCQIPLKTFFKCPKDQLLELLIHHQHMDLKMIHTFCDDFRLNVHAFYQILLKKTLLNWKLEYDRVEDVYGKAQINVKSNQNQLLEKCEEIVGLLESKESAYNFISSFRNEVNFYHYEAFFVIFTILGRLNKNKDYKKQLLLLHFLTTYRRINKPSDREIEEWYTLFPDSQTIDPLSQWRMPFTTTLFSIDVWKIIRPELDLRTYNTWFKVIPILDKNLNKNEICSFVIKEIVSSGVLQKSTTSGWALHPIHDHLFEQVDLCVQNMSNLEMATSAMYQFVMHTPKGADQVNAAKLCLKYAIRYKESGPENDPAILRAFIKVQKKYQSFAVNHILHLCQIDAEKYSEIVLEPNELIYALYMDESIIKRADRVLLNCADINKAVDDLSRLFNIDIHNTRLKLLECWLSEKLLPNSDLTVVSSLISSETDANSTNLIRAAYICQSEDKSEWQTFLLKIGLGETETKNYYYMANALSCFIIISNVSTIEQLTGYKINEFRSYVNKLYLLSDLDYLGLSMDAEALDKYKKSDLLRRLAQDIYNPVTVETMAALCMTYIEYDLKFWQVIITTAIKLNLVHSLKKYVNFLRNEPVFKYKQFYVDAWQKVVDQSFNINSMDIDRVYNSCVENILMIQSCPVLLSLNFVNIFNKCCNLQMQEFSAIIIQYLPKEQQKYYVQRIRNSKNNLIVSVGKLSTFGIWGTAQVQGLLES